MTEAMLDRKQPVKLAYAEQVFVPSSARYADHHRPWGGRDVNDAERPEHRRRVNGADVARR